MPYGGLFPSFWMTGFDCASPILMGHGRIDMTAEVQHDRFADADYAMLAHLGFRTARDGIRWYLIEKRPGEYDSASVEPLRQAAERHGLFVIWDICHYGWPDDVDPRRPSFPERFARFARAFAQYMRDHSAAVPCYVPINEVTYLSWAAGRTATFSPFAMTQEYLLKKRFSEASIAGIEAIRGVDKRARFLLTEPLTHIVAPPQRPDQVEIARQKNESRYQALDMIAGRLEPQLGGQPGYLDILGFDFYTFSQQDARGYPLDRFDLRWVPLSQLLAEAHARYGRPFIIAETSAVGPERGPWLEYVAGECERALESKLPLQGICLYPATSVPNWRTNACECYGLWDLKRGPDGNLARVLDEPYAETLRKLQERLRPYESQT